MRAIAILSAEHDAVLAALDRLDGAVARLEQRISVPVAAFADMRRFLLDFVDGLHHWKEEAAIFPHLDGCCAHGAALIQRLEEDHHRERRCARAFAGAVAGYVPGDLVAAGRVAVAARAYAAALRRHIAVETEELFPAMEHVLNGDDRAVIEMIDWIAIQGWRLRPPTGQMPGRPSALLPKGRGNHPAASRLSTGDDAASGRCPK